MPVQEATNLLKTLGDPTRLRLLRLMAHGELSVMELGEVAQLAQPRVSNHLKLLREEGLIQERRDGAFRYYRIDADRLPDHVRGIWPWVLEMWDGDQALNANLARLESVLSRRTSRGQFFERVASDWDRMRAELFGDSIARELLRAFIPAELVVADIGAGTGYTLELFGDRPRRIICIDNSEAMLAIARRKVDVLGLANVDFRLGDAHDPPLTPGEAGFISIAMVLHHLETPQLALERAANALAPGGHLFIADFTRHQEVWLREHMAHRHLGFPRHDIENWLTNAGLDLGYCASLPGRAWESPDGQRVQVPDGFAALAHKPQ